MGIRVEVRESIVGTKESRRPVTAGDSQRTEQGEAWGISTSSLKHHEAMPVSKTQCAFEVEGETFSRAKKSHEADPSKRRSCPGDFASRMRAGKCLGTQKVAQGPEQRTGGRRRWPHVEECRKRAENELEDVRGERCFF